MTHTSTPGPEARHLVALPNPKQRQDGSDDGRLSLADIPLGPWAGIELTVYGSRTGTKWHGNRDCPSLRTAFRHESHGQPHEGSLADLNLPEHLHCAPVGELGAYRQEADALLRFDAVTRKYAGLGPENLDLSAHTALDTTFSTLGNRSGPGTALLAPLRNRCRDERTEIASTVNEALRPRVPLMLAASWILTGRDAHHRHKPRFREFVTVVEEEFTARPLTAPFRIGSHAGRDAIPFWLGEVAAGRSPESATAALAAQEAEEATHDEKNGPDGFVAAVRDAWLRAGDRWSDILRGAALAHADEAVVIFRDRELASFVEWSLATLVTALVPGARVSTRDFSWVAARVPGQLVPFLALHDRGLIGLTLQTEAAMPWTGSNAGSSFVTC
ncbi:hypothetical protein ACFRCG_07475 [Embleya sp. NPDC056575]|uniref:hypothetical protein n=1 Tax=unclassified Embleya TaxID=2699296 RepID=UPI0036B87385